MNNNHPRESIDKPLIKTRPWIRCWARLFDIYLFAIFIGFFIFPFLPDSAFDINPTVLGCLILILWLLVETLLLSTVGTTPGKALLQIKLRDELGAKLSLSTAWSRSVHVWWRGMGVGIPIITLLTFIIAYRHATDGRAKTAWDEKAATCVTHRNIGWIRMMMLAACFAGFVYFMIQGQQQ